MHIQTAHHSRRLTPHPGFLTPAFVACSTNVKVELVTCNNIPGYWLDMWKSGTFFRIAVKRLSEPKKHHQDCLMSSAWLFRGPCLWSVAYSLTCSFLPLLHTSTQRPGMSMHITSFTRSSPVLVLQAANTEVRRPGYEATHDQLYYTSVISQVMFCKHSNQLCLEVYYLYNYTVIP